MGYFNEQSMLQPTSGFFGSRPVNGNIFSETGPSGGFFNDPANFSPAYETFVNNFAGSTGRFGDYLRQRSFKTQNQYGAAQANNPDLKFTDYIQGKQGDLQREYAGLTPQQTGATGQRGLRWL